MFMVLLSVFYTTKTDVIFMDLNEKRTSTSALLYVERKINKKPDNSSFYLVNSALRLEVLEVQKSSSVCFSRTLINHKRDVSNFDIYLIV